VIIRESTKKPASMPNLKIANKERNTRLIHEMRKIASQPKTKAKSP
jgi:hypothetical protein